MHNVHLSYALDVTEADVRVVFGYCDMQSPDESLHDVGSLSVKRDVVNPDRLVWHVPRDVRDQGCLHAYAGLQSLGRSDPISVSVVRKRQVSARVPAPMACGSVVSGT